MRRQIVFILLFTFLLLESVNGQEAKSFAFTGTNISFFSSINPAFIKLKGLPVTRYFKPGYSLGWGVEYKFPKILSVGGFMEYYKTVGIFNSNCWSCNPPKVTIRNTLKMNSFLIPVFVKLRTNKLPGTYFISGIGVNLLFYTKWIEEREYLLEGESMRPRLGEWELDVTNQNGDIIGGVFWIGCGQVFNVRHREVFSELYYFSDINLWYALIPLKRYGVMMKLGVYLGNKNN